MQPHEDPIDHTCASFTYCCLPCCVAYHDIACCESLLVRHHVISMVVVIIEQLRTWPAGHTSELCASHDHTCTVLVQQECDADGPRSQHFEHCSRQHVCLQEWHINGLSPNGRCVDGTTFGTTPLVYFKFVACSDYVNFLSVLRLMRLASGYVQE